jgi:hypothetical protein
VIVALPTIIAPLSAYGKHCFAGNLRKNEKGAKKPGKFPAKSKIYIDKRNGL